jgi:hypothetical protein
MAYSKFTALDLEEKFGISQLFKVELYSHVKKKPASDFLRTMLSKTISFALSQGTEKARSEYIIAPILLELKEQTANKVSIFSGIEFNVDRKLGFTGWCDFLISRSSFQRALQAPVVIAVEAKQQNFEKGIDQCIAEMLAAQIFNEKRGKEKQALIDTTVFDVGEDLERIIGLLYVMAMGEMN